MERLATCVAGGIEPDDVALVGGQVCRESLKHGFADGPDQKAKLIMRLADSRRTGRCRPYAGPAGTDHLHDEAEPLLTLVLSPLPMMLRRGGVHAILGRHTQLVVHSRDEDRYASVPADWGTV